MLPGFHSPAAGFEQPFELLSACHERVQRTLALLSRLQQHLQQHGCDAQARHAALDVMRYFDIAAPLHHEDEELHVFPPLLRSATSEIQQRVRKLQEDHRQMQLRWAPARATLCLVAEGEAGSWLPLSAEQTDTLQHFVDLYANHIEVEEQLVYPQAKMHLTASELRAMQNDMMQRRGANKTIQINAQ